MKTLLFLLLILLFSCTKEERKCYDCTQLTYTTWQRTSSCGVTDLVTYADTTYYKQRCDSDDFIRAWEINNSSPCGDVVMKCTKFAN